MFSFSLNMEKQCDRTQNISVLLFQDLPSSVHQRVAHPSPPYLQSAPQKESSQSRGKKKWVQVEEEEEKGEQVLVVLKTKFNWGNLTI